MNDSQKEQWIRAIEVFDEDCGRSDQLKLFAAERGLPECSVDGVQVRLFPRQPTEGRPPAVRQPEGRAERGKRSDGVQVVIALIVTPEGFPLAYEVLPGNTADKTTLHSFLQKIETQYGKARRIWIMDRGIPTEEVLAEMRESDPPVYYLVGTPKGHLGKLEAELLALDWQKAREGVEVKLLPRTGELYVLARSRDRVAKERAMRRRQLKKLWAV